MVRDQERISGRAGKGTVQDQACANLWQELVSNWKRRQQIIEYCVDVVDRSKEEKQTAAQAEEDSKRRRAIEAAVFSDDVMVSPTRPVQASCASTEAQRNQVHNELSVETIVRKRSLQGNMNGLEVRKSFSDALQLSDLAVDILFLR